MKIDMCPVAITLRLRQVSQVTRTCLSLAKSSTALRIDRGTQYDPERIGAPLVGFENHLNYFHKQGKGLPADLAKGLAVYLNSTIVDQYFRLFSGHTQVNATDLRKMPYPTHEQLLRLSRYVKETMPDQETIDDIMERECLNCEQ